MKKSFSLALALVLSTFALVGCGKDVPQEKDITTTINDIIESCSNIKLVSVMKTNGYQDTENPMLYNAEYIYVLDTFTHAPMENAKARWLEEQAIYNESFEFFSKLLEAKENYVKVLKSDVTPENYKQVEKEAKRLGDIYRALDTKRVMYRDKVNFLEYYTREESYVKDWYSKGCSANGKSFIKGIFEYHNTAATISKDDSKWFDKYKIEMKGVAKMRKTENGWRLAVSS